jgi:hypothetical protein
MLRIWNGRPSWLAILAVVCALGSLPGKAQSSLAEKILETSDIPSCDPSGLKGVGCCGAPGRRQCATTTCTNLSSGSQSFPLTGLNQQRKDPYNSGLIIDVDRFGVPVGASYQASIDCNIPPPSCDDALVKLRDSFSSTADGMDITFFATSDIHFFRESFGLPEEVRHVQEINSLGKLGMSWPPNIGIPGPLPSIHEPLAVVVAGDMGTNGGAEELGALRMLWEHGTMQDSLAYPIYAGLGNHDINLQRMLDYVGNRMCGVRMDPATHNYSWDWNKLHIVQLNTWLGDFNVAYTSQQLLSLTSVTATFRANAAAWLRNDLQTNATAGGRPVLIIQHFPLSSVQSTVPNCLISHSGSDSVPNCWWGSADYQLFWDTIKPYNVIGIVAGHTHGLSMDRPEMYGLDSKDAQGVPKIIDNFIDGRGGQSVHNSAKGVPPGPGRGDIMAFRVTDSYMDVAAFSWKTGKPIGYSNPIDFYDGDDDDKANGDAPTTNLHPFVGAQPACRKRINSRLIDVSPSAFSITNTGGKSQTVTVTVNSDIPGPVALSFLDQGLPSPPNVPVTTPPQQYFINLDNKSFVDSCAFNGRQFLLLTPDQPDAVLKKGQYSYTLNFSGVVSSPVFGLTVLTPISKARVTSGSPNPVVTVPATGNLIIDPVSIALYGPPNAPADIQVFQTGPLNAITCSSLPATDCNSLHFDAYGRILIKLTFDTVILKNTYKNQRGVITGSVIVTDNQSPNVIQQPLSLTFKAPVTVALSTIPQDPIPLGTPIVFSLHLTYPTTTDTSAGTGSNAEVEHPSGAVSLWQTDESGNNVRLLSRAFVNSHAEVNCNPPQTDFMIFGHTSDDGSGICPTLDLLNNPFRIAPFTPGAYFFAANYEGSADPSDNTYKGDSYFGPGRSLPVAVRVGQPVASMVTISGSSKTTYLNSRFDNPLQVQVLDAQNHPAPGVQVTFVRANSDSKLLPTTPTALFNGAPTSVVRSDANGMAVSAVLTANSNAGTYTMLATTGVPVQVQTPATLTNITGTTLPRLIGSVEVKSASTLDPPGSHIRYWAVKLQNFGGPAYGVQLDSLSLTQDPAATACNAPVVVTPMPILLHSITAVGGFDNLITVKIDFGNCTPTTFFTAKIGFSANGGVYHDVTTAGHQIP